MPLSTKKYVGNNAVKRMYRGVTLIREFTGGAAEAVLGSSSVEQMGGITISWPTFTDPSRYSVALFNASGLQDIVAYQTSATSFTYYPDLSTPAGSSYYFRVVDADNPSEIVDSPTFSVTAKAFSRSGTRFANATDVAEMPGVEIGDMIVGSPGNTTGGIYINSAGSGIETAGRVHIMAGTYDICRFYCNGMDRPTNPLVFTNFGGTVKFEQLTFYDGNGFHITGKYTANTGFIGARGHDSDYAYGRYGFDGGIIHAGDTNQPTQNVEIDYFRASKPGASGIKLKNNANALNYGDIKVHDGCVYLPDDEAFYIGETGTGVKGEINSTRIYNMRVIGPDMDVFQVNMCKDVDIYNNTIISSGHAWKDPAPTLGNGQDFGFSCTALLSGDSNARFDLHHNVFLGFAHAGQLYISGTGAASGIATVRISYNTFLYGKGAWGIFVSGRDSSKVTNPNTDNVDFEAIGNHFGFFDYQYDQLNNVDSEENTTDNASPFRMDLLPRSAIFEDNSYDTSVNFNQLYLGVSQAAGGAFEAIATETNTTVGAVPDDSVRAFIDDVAFSYARLEQHRSTIYETNVDPTKVTGGGDPITYPAGFYVTEGLDFYKSLRSNTGKLPSANPADWQKQTFAFGSSYPPFDLRQTAGSAYALDNRGVGYTSSLPDIPAFAGSFSTVTLASMAMKVWQPAGYTPGDTVDAIVDFCGQGQKGHADGRDIDNLDESGLGKYMTTHQPDQLVLMCQFPNAPTEFSSVAFLADQALDWLYANHTGVSSGIVSLGGYSLGSGILTEIADNNPAIVSRLDQYYTVANRTARSQDNGGSDGNGSLSNFAGLVGWFVYGDADTAATTEQTPLWVADINADGGDVVSTILPGVGHGGFEQMYTLLFDNNFFEGDTTRGQTDFPPSNLQLSNTQVAAGYTGIVGTLSADGVPEPTFSITGGADAADFSISGDTLNLDVSGAADDTKSVQITATNTEGSVSQTYSISVIAAQAPRGTGTVHAFNFAKTSESVSGYTTMVGNPYNELTATDNGVTLVTQPKAKWMTWDGNANSGDGDNGSAPTGWTNTEFPAGAARQYFYQGDNQPTEGDSTNEVIRVTGLSPATTYRVVPLSYRNDASQNRTTLFTITGANTKSVTNQGNAKDNTASVAMTGFQANADGSASIAFSRNSQFTFAYLNAIKFVEE